MTSVVVTGRGVTTSVGEEVDEMFDALLAGRSGIVDGIGPCSEFDPDPVLTPKGARRTDRFSQLGVAAADKAWAESGLSEDNVDLTRVGVLIGTGVGGLITLENECTKFLEGGERAVSPLFVTMMMPNAPAGLISMRIGARGPGFSVASACATGSHAIGEAKRIIERGEADVVVAGGCEAALTGLCLAAFKTMGALSQDGISRPFDANRTGFVMGEGAGVVVLEREDHAKARGATIYGRIAGYGASSDAYHITAPDPEGRGSTAAIRLALAGRGRAAVRRRLRQRPWHRHAAQRRRRDQDAARDLQRRRAAGQFDQVAHRPPARRGRRRRGGRVPGGGSPRRPAADDQPRDGRPRVRPRLHPGRPARGAGHPDGSQQLLRIRWAERLPGGDSSMSGILELQQSYTHVSLARVRLELLFDAGTFFPAAQ